MKMKSAAFLICLLLLSVTTSGQGKTEYYSQNFILRGKVMDGVTGRLLKNECITVLAFESIRTVCTNEKGEYQIKFFDTTGVEPYLSFEIIDGELHFISGEDPNRRQTIYLKRTKIKKSTKKDDGTGKPELLTINIKLEYDFD